MKGVGWEASKSLDVQQAKKAGELVSEVTPNHFAYKALQVIRCNCVKYERQTAMPKRTVEKNIYTDEVYW